jgi:hypothetical protein
LYSTRAVIKGTAEKADTSSMKGDHAPRRKFLAAVGATWLAGAMAKPRQCRASERPSINTNIDAAWQAGLAAIKPTRWN